MTTWPTRTHYRLASIPLLIAVGLNSAAAEEGKSEPSVDFAALAESVTLDPKLSRCTISKERKGDGLQSLLKALKEGKPPVVARAIHRWKQKRMSGETRRTPKFVFGSQAGSDKDAKLAIMSDEYDSLAWGPTFDKTGGKKLYEKLGKSVDCKCETPLNGQLDPMLTGLRQALKVTGKTELISWGEKFNAHDLAAVAQHVIATQEPQEGEISDGVKLEVGLQTYSTRQLFGYMHPVYDPEANALSCEKLEDSVPISTEFQLYVALTGLEGADEIELAEAFDGDDSQGEIAQGDADLAEADDEQVADGEFATADGEEYVDYDDPAAEEQDLAALQPNDSGFVDDTDPGAEVADATDEDFRETDEDAISEEAEEEYADDADVDEPVATPRTRRVSSSSRRGGYKNLREDYYDEEPVSRVRRGPIDVVEDIEDDVDDWYDYPGYYDPIDVVTIYREPPPPVIIVAPVYASPVVAIFGGAIVFAAVTRPRWSIRPWWWGGPRPWARNNVVVNVNFVRPFRARRFRPGWGLRQNRGFVRRTPRNLARRGNRLIRARANLGPRRGARGRPGLWKNKRRNAGANAIRKARRNQSAAPRRAIARRKANARRAAGNKKALAKRRAAVNRKAAAKRKGAARRKAAARKTAARKNAAKRKRVASRKAAQRRNSAANKRKAAARRKAASSKKAAARRKAAQRRKSAARRTSAKRRKSAARRSAAQRRKSAARRGAAKRRNSAARSSAAKRRRSAARRNSAQRRRSAARRGAAQRRRATPRRRAAPRRRAGPRRQRRRR